jgi:bis(5'-adenosyl)-triphosphatase
MLKRVAGVEHSGYSHLEDYAMTDDRAPNCPFDDGKIKAVEYAGNDHFAALYNVAPILPGHSLVIPRRHVESFLDLSDEEITGLFLFARNLTGFLIEQFKADGFDVSLQDGEVAGQTVPHVHLHVILRWSGDLPNPGDWHERLKLPVTSYSENAIDSRSRPRMSSSELSRIVGKLSDEARAHKLI